MKSSLFVKTLNKRKAFYCNGCKKEFESEDDYLDHVYDADACLREHFASERKGMSRE